MKPQIIGLFDDAGKRRALYEGLNAEADIVICDPAAEYKALCDATAKRENEDKSEVNNG